MIEPGMGAFLSILNPAISAIKRCPAAAIMIRRVRDGIISRRAPKATSMGFKFAGLKAMQRGEFEPHETAIVRRILPAVDIFINVGANTGYYCCWALSSGKHTVAFEPIDTNLRVLYRNIQANRFESPFEVFPVALSDAAGLTTIYGSGTGASLIRGWSHIDEKDLRVVPVMRLDDVLGGRFRGQKCFVLVDIEGAEYRMLLGGARIPQAGTQADLDGRDMYTRTPASRHPNESLSCCDLRVVLGERICGTDCRWAYPACRSRGNTRDCGHGKLYAGDAQPFIHEP